MKEKLITYLEYLKVYCTSTKGRYTLAFLVPVLILLISVSLLIKSSRRQTSPITTTITPTITTATPTVTVIPTSTPFIKRLTSPTIHPTPIRKVTSPTQSSTTSSPAPTTNNNQSPTATPQPTATPTPSLPTITVSNGSEFTFQVGYDSQLGYTPPAPNYDHQYLQFLMSSVTNPNYKSGDHVDEEFRFKALKTGETLIEVTRRDTITRYRVIIN